MKKQELQQISAYDKKAVHDMFIMTMEWLEKYIETVGYYPDWENRKQIHENNIKRKDVIGNPEKVKSSFSTVLFILQTNLQDVPPMFREEIKQEFYKWISAVGIDIDNCRSDELKVVLYQVNEILKGHGEKIQKDVENRKREVEMDSPEYMDKFKKMFASVQDPIRKEKEVEKIWKSKTDKDWKKESRFNSGSAEQGEQIFNQIAGSVANQQSDFYFFRQKDQSINPQQKTNSEIIQDVKNNPQNWRIDEIITEYNSLGRVSKKEMALIHNFLAEVSFDGAVVDAQQPVYLIQRFSSEEKAEIEQILGISQSSSTVQATRNLIEEIKRNIHEFEFQTILTFNGHHYDSVKKRWVKHGDGEKSETILVHKSVQISEKNYNEFGCLSIQQDKMFQEHRFSREEWSEIKKALENSEVIKRVEQNRNNWIIATVNHSSDGSYEALINKSAIEGRNLNISGEFYNKELFTDEEWTKIGNIKNQQHSNRSQQVFSVLDSQSNQSNSSSLFITLAVISVLLVSGLKLVKKHLNNKGKE